MTCPYCGAQQPEDTRFCTECGKYIGPKPEEEHAEQTAPVAPVPVVSQQQPVEIKPAEPDPDPAPSKNSQWATIGTWGWIGILILLQIPLVNVVLVILWSFGIGKKRVKQSFARAVLVLTLVVSLITIVSTILAAHYWGPRLQDMMQRFR